MGQDDDIDTLIEMAAEATHRSPPRGPSVQEGESYTARLLVLPESKWVVIQMAIDKVRAICDANIRWQDALVLICADFLAGAEPRSYR